MGLFNKLVKHEEVEEIKSQEQGFNSNDLTEYMSFDSIKAHLVDTLEENRRLRNENKNYSERIYKEKDALRKEKEIALIEADEWKKRNSESEKEIQQLKREIDKQADEIKELKREKNDALTKAEMAEHKFKEIKKDSEVKKDSFYLIKKIASQYSEYQLRRLTKDELIAIIRNMANGCKETEDQDGCEEE